MHCAERSEGKTEAAKFMRDYSEYALYMNCMIMAIKQVQLNFPMDPAYPGKVQLTPEHTMDYQLGWQIMPQSSC